MSAQSQSNQAQTNVPPITENKPSDKELNFRMLEAKYEKQLSQERQAREAAERETQRLSQERNRSTKDDEDDDAEPYVDHKKLKKEQAKFGQQIKQETKEEIQSAVQHALTKERQSNWLKQNPDFYDVLQHAEKLALKDPELAESILEMPEGVERQKLVYKSIKALGLHKPEQKAPSIQDKIDSNRKGPYYQPSGVGSAPYASAGDFSASGQKNAYEKMQELKNKLRL